MRRIRSVTLIFLILLLLLSGCDSAGTAETTAPPETTVPVETTLPPETTMPPETTKPKEPTIEMHPFYDELLSTGFQHSAGELKYTDAETLSTDIIHFAYTEESNVIDLVTLNMTLTLPEEWMDHVAIYQTCRETATEGIYNGYCYVVNWDLTAAYWDVIGIGPLDRYESFASDYYICFLYATSKDEYLYDDPREPEYAIYLGESDTHYYYMQTIDTQNPNCSERLHAHYHAKNLLGEDTFNKLTGDMVMDYDRISEMITIPSHTQP